eukprot:CAMPEP_0198276524 /NCGR_PEP_ID=MMETSP1447-20131203/65357_1 /TAXON_ID=420782 /ORGANISM="Chaetoceros dichaeta, Strain CCMP1751" /LENGTH=396 /DNA_ID=CAMNT_0043971479 /DNA_START=59 /DNA_END=1249 /DNA_ORIENTATION=-
MPESASCGFCQFIEDCAGGDPTGKQFLVFARNAKREMSSTEKGGEDVIYAYVDGCGGSRNVDSKWDGVSAYDLKDLDALTAVASGVSVARIVADSEGSDVVNTNEVDSNNAKCSTPDVMCIDVYAPVKCENECTYSNLCFALTAQQLNCCPIPDEDTACITLSDPITCADGCVYENECFAVAAGFNITNCLREPYDGDKKLVFLITFTERNEMATIIEQIQNAYSEFILEIELLSAVGIGIVEFDIKKISKMDAMSLLQDFEGIKTVEEDSIVSIDNISEQDDGTVDVMCIDVYAPVKCENECTYSNLCFALTAQQLNCCPIPDDDTACITLSDPITCADGCVYENECFAVAAGFNISTCLREPIKETTSGSIGGFVVSLWTSGFVFSAAAKMTIM